MIWTSWSFSLKNSTWCYRYQGKSFKQRSVKGKYHLTFMVWPFIGKRLSIITKSFACAVLVLCNWYVENFAQILLLNKLNVPLFLDKIIKCVTNPLFVSYLSHLILWAFLAKINGKLYQIKPPKLINNINNTPKSK